MSDDPNLNPNDPPADPGNNPPADPPSDPPSDPGNNPPADPPAADDWRAGIQDEKLSKFAERFTTPQDALKTAFEFRQKLSNAVTLPGKNAGEDELKEFYSKLGVPESPDGYEMAPSELPEGLDAEEISAELQELAQVLHKSGATPAVARAVAETRLQARIAEQERTQRAISEARDAQEAALKKEWGADYEPNVKYAARAAKQFGDETFGEFINQTVDGVRIGDHPAFLKAFATIGRKMGEGGLHAIMDTADKQSMEQQMDDLTRQAHDANSRGDRSKADQLFRQRDELAKQYYGDGS